MNSNWIISITAGWAQVHSIKFCKKLGFNVLSVDQNPKAKGFAFSDEYLVAKIDDIHKITNFIKNKNITPIGIVGFVSDAAIVPVGMLRNHYKMPSQTIDMLISQIDKEKQLALLKDTANIPQSFVISNLKEAKSTLNSLKYPLIAKPTVGSGSRGVNKIDSANDLEKIEDSLANSRNGKIVLQEFIEGDEYSIETFCYEKKIKFLATSKREVNDSMSATEIFTYEIDKTSFNKMTTEIEKVYEVFNYPNGPGHFELIRDQNGYNYIIDIHFRGGGFDIFNYLVKEVSGFDIVYNTIMQCLNKELNLNHSNTKNNVFIKFLNGHKGVLKKIDGINKVNKIKGIRTKTFFKVGEKIYDSKSDGDRIVMLTCSSKNINTCKKLLNEAVKKINIEIV